MVYIPGFLIGKVYERGSLRNTERGFEFAFVNRMTPLRISGMRDMQLLVDDSRRPPESLRLTLAGQPLDMTGGSVEGTVAFDKDSRLVFGVDGEQLTPGRHQLKIGFITNEYGGATLKVTDMVGETAQPSFFGRIKELFTGPTGPAQPEAPGPVKVDGELGGVPLDPDFSRLEAAIRREEPDRVPLFEAEIAPPLQEWFLGREIADARDVVEFYVRAGYDFVPVVPPYFTPRLMHSTSSADGGDGGDRMWISESEGLIKTIKDVEEFPWQKAEDVDFSSFDDVAQVLPPKMKTLGLLSPAAIFGNVSQAMGLQNFCLALFKDLPLVEALFERIGPTYLEIAKRLVKVPRLGAVFMTDDLAYTTGCFCSPVVYRKYVFPWYKRIGEVLDNAGVPFLFHSDGRLWDVLDDLADCGVKGIHPVEPLAMDIVDLKKRYGDRFCIFGNIDLEYTLTRGTVDEVTEAVKKRIRELAPGGGYGVAASNSVPDYVKPENYRAMIEATKRYGKYPISL